MSQMPELQELIQRLEEMRQNLGERDRQVQGVLRISQALSCRLELDDLLQAALQESLKVVKADAGTLYLYHPRQDELEFKYVLGPAAELLIGERRPADQCMVAGQVLRDGAPLITDKHTPPRDIIERTHYATRNMVTVPLMSSEGKPIGVLQALNKEGGADFDSSDRDLLMILATQAATAIETARLHNEARLAEVVKLIGDIEHDMKNLVTPIEVGIRVLEARVRDFIGYVNAALPSTDQASSAPEVAHPQADLFYETCTSVIAMSLDASQRIQAKTREIADLIENVDSAPTFRLLELRPLVEAEITLLRYTAQQQGIAIAIELPEELPGVPLDGSRIRSIIYNLIDNARIAMARAKETDRPMRGTRIHVRAFAELEGHFPEGRYLQIEVADEGPGMTEEVRDSLFTENPMSTVPGGTGLGTRIVDKVVGAHNGLAWVESELGQGSTFFIRLPLDQPPK